MTRAADWPIDDLELDARGSRFDCRASRLAHSLPAGRRAPGGERRHRRRGAGAAGRLRSRHRSRHRRAALARPPGARLASDPEIILDGAHNPAGARALAAYIDRFYADRRVRLIYGAMRDKAVAEIGGILFPLARQVIVTAPRQARASRRDHARDRRPRESRVAPDIEAALAMATDAESSSSPARCSWWPKRARCWREIPGPSIGYPSRNRLILGYSI